MTEPTKDLKGNQPKDRAQELAADCIHDHVMYHYLRYLDGSLERWWQCEDCEVKFVRESELRKETELAVGSAVAAVREEDAQIADDLVGAAVDGKIRGGLPLPIVGESWTDWCSRVIADAIRSSSPNSTNPELVRGGEMTDKLTERTDQPITEEYLKELEERIVKMKVGELGLLAPFVIPRLIAEIRKHRRGSTIFKEKD